MLAWAGTVTQLACMGPGSDLSTEKSGVVVHIASPSTEDMEVEDLPQVIFSSI